MTITLTTRPLRSDRILKEEAGGTVVLLDMDDGRYFTLDEVGGRVWDLCDGSRTVLEMAALLEDEYEAPQAAIERDLLALLTDLAHERLVGDHP